MFVREKWEQRQEQNPRGLQAGPGRGFQGTWEREDNPNREKRWRRESGRVSEIDHPLRGI